MPSAVPHPVPLEQENARLRRAVVELSVLNEVAGEIGAMREPEAVMAAIVRRATEATGAEQGLITLVDPAHTDTQQTLVRGNTITREADRFHVPPALLGWMHLHRRPLALQPPYEPPHHDLAWHPAIRSVLLVPLLVKGTLTGILAVFNKRDGGRFDGGDERLLSILAGQSAQVLENARLWRQEQDLQRLQSELSVAAGIQTRLLPRYLPDLSGYRLAAECRPAQTVGGDFYDVIPVHDGLVALCVGDVSGKGLPAALVAANAQALLRSLLRWGTPVHEALARASRLLYESTDARTFVTLFACVLDVARHTVSYANAGHHRPLLSEPGTPPRPLEGGGLALGLRPDATYEAATVTLAPGGVLVIYSDGVPEAMSPSREEFGEERFYSTLATYGGEPAAEIQQRVLERVLAHTGQSSPSDDITLLVLQRV